MPVYFHDNQPPAIAQEEIDRWKAVPPAVAADLVTDGQNRSVQIDPAIRPLKPAGQQPKLFGRAVTALCEPPDFGPVLYAADLITKGDVLVIAAGGHSETAMIGEIVCGYLKRQGAVGVICDGAIRDVGAIAKMHNFSAYTRHVTPRGPTSADRGAVNATVVVGGRPIAPGDLIIGDDDGLIALSVRGIREGIQACEDKLANEHIWELSLTSGNSAAETFNLPPAQRP